MIGYNPAPALEVKSTAVPIETQAKQKPTPPTRTITKPLDATETSSEANRPAPTELKHKTEPSPKPAVPLDKPTLPSVESSKVVAAPAIPAATKPIPPPKSGISGQAASVQSISQAAVQITADDVARPDIEAASSISRNPFVAADTQKPTPPPKTISKRPEQTANPPLAPKPLVSAAKPSTIKSPAQQPSSVQPTSEASPMETERVASISDMKSIFEAKPAIQPKPSPRQPTEPTTMEEITPDGAHKPKPTPPPKLLTQKPVVPTAAKPVPPPKSVSSAANGDISGPKPVPRAQPGPGSSNPVSTSTSSLNSESTIKPVVPLSAKPVPPPKTVSKLSDSATIPVQQEPAKPTVIATKPTPPPKATPKSLDSTAMVPKTVLSPSSSMDEAATASKPIALPRPKSTAVVEVAGDKPSSPPLRPVTAPVASPLAAGPPPRPSSGPNSENKVADPSKAKPARPSLPPSITAAKPAASPAPVLPSTSSPQTDAAAPKEGARKLRRVRDSYVGVGAGELSLKAGDMVIQLSEGDAAGMAKGMLKSGQLGLFPLSKVAPL